MADDSSEPQQPEQGNFFRKPRKNKNIRKRNLNEDQGIEEEEEEKRSFFVSKKKPILPNNSKLHFSTAPEEEEESDGQVKTVFQFESSSEIQVENDSSRATVTLDTDTHFSRRPIHKSCNDDKLYKGMNAYKAAGFRREPAGASHGPLRPSAHIRVSTRVDYQPDICKDYRDTGYCGYGDSCKFMHHR